MDKKPFIPKEGKGRIFKKNPQGNQPDFKGDAMINSVHVEISGWVQVDASISLSIQKKQERQPSKPRRTSQGDFADIPTPAPKSNAPVEEDDVPF